MTSTHQSTETEQALNTMGFPKQVIVGAISTDDRAALESVLTQETFEVQFFAEKEKFEEVFQPAILGGFAEALLNEGVVMRRLKAEIDKGRQVFTSYLEDESAAVEVAPSLYRHGASNLCYFGDAGLRRIAPPNQEG